jgi:CotH kinase protein
MKLLPFVHRFTVAFPRAIAAHRSTRRPRGAHSALLASAVAAGTVVSGCTENYYDTKDIFPLAKPDAAVTHAPGTGALPTATAKPVDDAGATGPDAGDAEVGDAATDAAEPLSPPDATPGDTGTAPEDAGDASSADAYVGPLEPGAPIVNTTPAQQADFELFGEIANHYWFVVDPAQVELMNSRWEPPAQDIYSPAGNGSKVTYADHLLVTRASDGLTADYGKLQVRLVGSSTFAPWEAKRIPNIKIDADEFTDGLRVGGFEHFRFNNAQIGTIFREKFILDMFKKLNYPSLKTQYAWVGSSVWGPGIEVPYIMVESYKRPFCEAWASELGGGCENMWEGYGDPFDSGYGYGGNYFENPEYCQFDSCSSTRANEARTALALAPQGEGFKAATSDYVDWPSFHKYQCDLWILQIYDDALHVGNNVVLVERTDGKFQYLPWSVDISLSGYSQSLAGNTAIARGCQGDSQCWADTLSTCEAEIEAFIAADPVGVLDGLYADLGAAGMLRNGDDGFYEDLRRLLEARVENLPADLDDNRDPNPYGYGNDCERFYGYGFELCGDHCVPFGQCQLCEPEAPPVVADAGIADGGPADAGSAPGDAASTDAAVPVDPPVCVEPGYYL